ncbi:helix-turn-helix transcriptional regulator [Alkalimonas collagenimarina]|uniref:Helix-turn-helix transcriptional regulator n=1 Tax=Alkalimonas collagenimarina TaxID=400390 RepID=A0ABT9GUK7_9GAMM|nr:helix-turn-helix transcriptional regulator [Alkalimonas collagenimarina]MDP4534735.1 helix-turn-helix transcriptional regulator [Alkalimonas collagenimarina]
MPSQRLSRMKNELTDFLLHHRNKLKPVDVGLPTSHRRRTPGLRREEVAALAGVGLTWYTWFEQGRDIQVSESFLLNIAKALKLNDAECCHLFLLAHRRPPAQETFQEQSIDPLTQSIMDELARPAYIMDLRWNLIAWNTPADELFSLAKRQPAERNLLRLLFTDPQLRSRLPNWQHDAVQLLAQFRCDMAAAPEDPFIQQLIAELKQLSPAFNQLWATPKMENYSRGIQTIMTNDRTPKRFQHKVLAVDEFRNLNMIIYFAIS